MGRFVGTRDSEQVSESGSETRVSDATESLENASEEDES